MIALELNQDQEVMKTPCFYDSNRLIHLFFFSEIAANSRHSSQPPSRTGSDLSIDSLDNSNPKLSTYKFTPKSLANKKIDSRQGSYTNIRDRIN